MKLSLALLAVLQLSHALHVRHEADKSGIQELKRTTQNAASNDITGTLSVEDGNVQKPKKTIPWWKLPNTSNGEMNALTGQQFYPFDDENNSNDDSASTTAGNDICPISQCQGSEVLNKFYCGQHARCLRSYCQCDFGWKPASNTPMARGWTGLEALTVWVDAYDAGCTERCDSLSCSEVPQVKGCLDDQVTHDDNNDGDNLGQEGLATDGLHLGAIKAPGADAGIGG